MHMVVSCRVKSLPFSDNWIILVVTNSCISTVGWVILFCIGACEDGLLEPVWRDLKQDI